MMNRIVHVARAAEGANKRVLRFGVALVHVIDELAQTRDAERRSLGILQTVCDVASSVLHLRRDHVRHDDSWTTGCNVEKESWDRLYWIQRCAEHT